MYLTTDEGQLNKTQIPTIFDFSCLQGNPSWETTVSGIWENRESLEYEFIAAEATVEKIDFWRQPWMCF